MKLSEKAARFLRTHPLADRSDVVAEEGDGWRTYADGRVEIDDSKDFWMKEIPPETYNGEQRRFLKEYIGLEPENLVTFISRDKAFYLGHADGKDLFEMPYVKKELDGLGKEEGYSTDRLYDEICEEFGCSIRPPGMNKEDYQIMKLKDGMKINL